MAVMPSRPAAIYLALCAAVLALTACEPREAQIKLGTWRATLAVPAGELPFGLEFGREDNALVAWLVNAGDRTRVDEITIAGDRLTMRMPGYDHRIEAQIAGNVLRGTLIQARPRGEEQRLPFVAQFGQTWRFFAKPAEAATNISGRWAVTFGTGEKASPGVGEFVQKGNAVTGTILTPSGDHRYIEGEIRGNEIWLSKFDGGSASLYRARVNAQGELEGSQAFGVIGGIPFVARRDAQASLGDAESKTQMRSGTNALDIEFPDLAGTKVSLRDPRFTGKAIIVTLAGSWCPNCHDEAALLSALYRQHKARGLEIVALMFEHYGDFPRAVAAVTRFGKRYDIDYTMLIAGTSDKDDAASRLPQLNGVFAFPTTIFIDRQGHVRKVHTGFSGPATGEHYRKLTEEFGALVEQLISESADASKVRPSGT